MAWRFEKSHLTASCEIFHNTLLSRGVISHKTLLTMLWSGALYTKIQTSKCFAFGAILSYSGILVAWATKIRNELQIPTSFLIPDRPCPYSCLIYYVEMRNHST